MFETFSIITLRVNEAPGKTFFAGGETYTRAVWLHPSAVPHRTRSVTPQLIDLAAHMM
jgi:hypothetical protein